MKLALLAVFLALPLACGTMINAADRAQVEYNACFARGCIVRGITPQGIALSADEVKARLESLDAFLARNKMYCSTFNP